MSKQFCIPIKIIVSGFVAVEADGQEEAYDLADKTMFWAYQNGDPAADKNVSITNCEIEVEGEELNLYDNRWGDE